MIKSKSNPAKQKGVTINAPVDLPYYAEMLGDDLTFMSEPREIDNSSISTLELFHGTDKEIEGRFNISLAGSGIGWLNDSYGAGIYFSTNVEAARYYAFKAVQNTIIKNRIETGQENTDKLTEQRVYRTTLKQGAKILDASEPIDSKRAKEILLKAGVSETVIKVYTKKELSQFTRIARLIHKNPAFNNGFEYLTKELGYQGLKIKDEIWEKPEDVNFAPDYHVDFELIFGNLPEIVVVYDENILLEPVNIEEEEPEPLTLYLGAAFKPEESNYTIQVWMGLRGEEKYGGMELYLCTNREAARYYSCEAERIRLERIKEGKGVKSESLKNMFEVTLNSNVKVLDAEKTKLNPNEVKAMLREAGVIDTLGKYFNDFTDEQLSEVDLVAELLYVASDVHFIYYHICDKFGYDGIKIKDKYLDRSNTNLTKFDEIDYEEINNDTPYLLLLFNTQVIDKRLEVSFEKGTETFEVISPDGFSISMESYNSIDEAILAVNEWVKRYETQGYYSSNRGRIPFEYLPQVLTVRVYKNGELFDEFGYYHLLSGDSQFPYIF